jgi:hypothetical protein
MLHLHPQAVPRSSSSIFLFEEIICTFFLLRLFSHTKAKMIAQDSIIAPDYDEGPPRKRVKKIYSINQSIICRPSTVSGVLQHPTKLQSSIPRTVVIVQKGPIEFDSSFSHAITKKRSSSSQQTTMPLVKPQPLSLPPRSHLRGLAASCLLEDH